MFQIPSDQALHNKDTDFRPHTVNKSKSSIHKIINLLT